MRLRTGSTYFRTDVGSDPGYRPRHNEEEYEGRALRTLSPREWQVLKLVVEGRTSKEIAGIVGVKPGSIDTYRSRIMAKLELHDIPSLVRFAVRRGVIKP